MAMVILSERFQDSPQKNIFEKEYEIKKEPNNKYKYFNKVGHVISKVGIENQKIQNSLNIHKKESGNFLINNDNPGPGQYDVPKDFIMSVINKNNKNNNNNGNFLTNTPRFDNISFKSEDLPGPGYYNLNDTHKKLILKKPINYAKIKHL